MRKKIFSFIIIPLFLGGCFQPLVQPQNTDESRVGTQPDTAAMSLSLTSPAFVHQAVIPVDYTCDGEDINPPLEISGVPKGAKSLVLIVDDPDAPAGVWVHWLLWNIPPHVTLIEEDSVPDGIQGTTDFNRALWGGPCPPSGVHRYFFKLYAIDTLLNLTSGARKAEVEEAMESHILDEAVLMGKYSRG